MHLTVHIFCTGGTSKTLFVFHLRGITAVTTRQCGGGRPWLPLRTALGATDARDPLRIFAALQRPLARAAQNRRGGGSIRAGGFCRAVATEKKQKAGLNSLPAM